MNRILLLLCLMLQACTQAASAIQPVEVDMPVAAGCALAPLVPPVWQADTLAATATDTERIRALINDLETSRGYNAELEAELSACG